MATITKEQIEQLQQELKQKIEEIKVINGKLLDAGVMLVLSLCQTIISTRWQEVFLTHLPQTIQMVYLVQDPRRGANWSTKSASKTPPSLVIPSVVETSHECALGRKRLKSGKS